MIASLKECKIYFNPIQQGGGDPSPENIRPILPHTEFEINNAQAVNLLIPQNSVNYSQSGVNLEYLGSGLYHIYGYGDFSTDSALGLPNIQLAESFVIPASTNGGKLFFNNSTNGSTIYLKYANGNKIDSWDMSSTNRKVNSYAAMANKELAIFSIAISTSQSGKNIDIFFRPVFMQNLISNITISLPSGISGLYGGYIDLVKGEIVQTHTDVTLNSISSLPYGGISGDSWSWSKECHIFRWDEVGRINSYNNHDAICDTAINSTSPDRDPADINGLHVTRSSYYNVSFHAPLGANATTEQLDNYLQQHPIHIVCPYRLTSLYKHYSIDPIILKTLRGTNNIWSTANGNIELKYYTH